MDWTFVDGEWQIGTFPRQDCAGYSPDLPTPTWSQVLDKVLEEDMINVTIVIVGKLGSDRRDCSGAAIRTGWNDLVSSVEEPGIGRLRGRPSQNITAMEYVIEGSIARNPLNTSAIATVALDLATEPEHITGIVLRER